MLCTLGLHGSSPSLLFYDFTRVTFFHIFDSREGDLNLRKILKLAVGYDISVSSGVIRFHDLLYPAKHGVGNFFQVVSGLLFGDAKLWPLVKVAACLFSQEVAPVDFPSMVTMEIGNDMGKVLFLNCSLFKGLALFITTSYLASLHSNRIKLSHQLSVTYQFDVSI